jgi:hypothetical protein
MAFSTYFCPRQALADKCSYAAIGREAPAQDKVDSGQAGKTKSVTLFVPTGKAQSLAITVPGEVVDGTPSGKVQALLFGNAVVAIDEHLAGKNSSTWECVTGSPAKFELDLVPDADGNGAGKPAPAERLAGTSKPTRPGTQEKQAPSVAPASAVVKPDGTAKGAPLFRFGGGKGDIITLTLVITLPDGASKKVALEVSKPWLNEQGMSKAKTAIATKLDSWMKGDGTKMDMTPVYQQLDRQLGHVQDMGSVKSLPPVK